MKERIKNVIKRVFNLTEVADDFSRFNCERWDSLNFAILIAKLETEFNISIEPEEISEMISLADIERILNKLLKR